MSRAVDGRKKIGIVGGMGPLATVDLFRMLVERTKSASDAGHIRIFIDDNPQIPDRTAAILHGGESPVPAIVESARALERLGAGLILIPCNTSHFFYDDIQAAISAEVIHMVRETAHAIRRDGIAKVGILATTGTIRGRVYEREFASLGIECVLPSPAGQDAVMDFIYSGVKAGRPDFDASPFRRVVDFLLGQGVRAILLGCTELSLGCARYGVSLPRSVNPVRILAETAILKAGYELA